MQCQEYHDLKETGRVLQLHHAPTRDFTLLRWVTGVSHDLPLRPG